MNTLNDPRTFRYNGATITVRPTTGMDVMRIRLMYRKLVPEPSDPDYDLWLMIAPVYVKMVQCSTIEGSLGFDWPSPTADTNALRKAAEQLLMQSSDLYLRWEEELNQVDTPPNDPDLLPPEHLTSDQKKAPASSKNAPSSEATSKP